MDYNKLKTFVQVAELGSITQAANLMKRSQSAISQQMQLLEHELGIRLLERRNGKVFLSADAERLYPLAKEKLQQIDNEVLSIKKATKHVEGHIRLGVLSDDVNPFEAGRHIGAFCSNHPNVSVSVIYGTSTEIEQRLLANQIDLGFAVHFNSPELFVRQPINTALHRVYVSQAYLKKKGPIRTYRNLLEADLIDLNESFACFGTWLRKNSPELVANLMRRRPRVVAPSHRTAAEIVSAGFGVALLPDHLLTGREAKNTYVELFKSAMPVRTGMDVAHRTNKTLKLSESLFIIETCTNKGG